MLAISESSLEGLEREVAQRNEERYRGAMKAFEKRGFVVTNAKMLFASLGQHAYERCDARVQAAQGVDAGVLDEAEPIQVDVKRPAGADGQQPPGMNTVAPAKPACDFFRGRVVELRVKKPDGSDGTLMRIRDDVLLAREASGARALVSVRVEPRVVERKKVLVKRTCNRMPVPYSEVLDRRAVRVVWADAKPTRELVIAVEREELDVECTENLD